MIDYAVSKCNGLTKTQFQGVYSDALQDMIAQYGGQSIFLIILNKNLFQDTVGNQDKIFSFELSYDFVFC